jgi:hypothetical protein
MRRSLAVLVAVVAAVAAILVDHPRAAEETLIPSGSSWRYLDTGANLGTAWRTTAYSDTAWPSGLAQLGYGDTDESTVLSFGGNTTNRYITYYFRKSFAVASPASIGGLTLRVLRDDGCVVYLNGVEVWRSNMPTGTITSSTLATTAIGGADESAWHQVSIDPAQLVAGTNLIAVEVHQQAITSTDVSFDLELRAMTTTPGPSIGVTLVSPADDGIANSTDVTFTANVSATAGLASATLQIGGPAQTVTLTGPAQISDAQITADSPSVANGSALSINVDGQTPHAHGLMKFGSLVGSAPGQVPAGSIISSATLTLDCTNPGQSMRLYRLTQDWTEDQATWAQRQTGVAWGAAGADGAASNAGVALTGDCTVIGQRQIDLTPFVQEWVGGQPNFGLVMVDSGTDGVDFSSSESAASPSLTVVFKEPLVPSQTQALSGTSATATFTVPLASGTTYSWNVEVADLTGLRQRAAGDFDVTINLAAPDEPVLISPANGAVDVSPSAPLVARVTTPAGGNLTVTASIRKASREEFTIVVLPDTQHYSEAFPAIFTAQTQWIVAQKAARNIVFVTHEGDIVQNYGLVAEWDRANTSMTLLDGVVPYGLAPGNHDQPSTLYNQYFPFTRYLGLPWYGGHYQSLNDNNFQLFSGGGMDFVAVHLEFCPPAGAVAWAKSVFDSYPNRIGLMTTHGYLNELAQRTVHSCTDTSYLWNNLGAITPNLHFMLSGHVHDESRRDDSANGHPVYQMLADYQDRASGGEGWLRIMHFLPAENRVDVQTYSPWLDRYERDANSEFSLDFPMSAPWSTSAPIVVPNGTHASFLAGLDPSTKYEWRVTVTNGAGQSRSGPIWTFTTDDAATNQPPTASGGSVTLAEDTPMGVTVTASDPEGQPITYTLVQTPAHGTLSGVLPAVTYTPAANFNGADSFSFRVSDGELSSGVAAIALTVNPVNDAPAATGESYAATAGVPLTLAAPGVLGNDSDVDGTVLSALLVSGPLHGVLALGATGGFTYTATAGYVGADSFTYRATDGALSSGVVTVGLTVAGVPAGPLFSAAFTSGADGFTYVDDPFRGTSQPAYSSGSHITNGGFSGGGLRVYVGGIDNLTVSNMSGGFRRSFSLAAPAAISLTFRYRLDQGKDYESDEVSQVLASLNGALVGGGAAGYIAQLAGNGDKGQPLDTGWRIVTIDLGTLAAGTHTLTLGGYNNKKNSTSERTTILIDDVSVVVR